MKEVSAVLLAAGESQRMGEINKLHLPIDDVPLLRRSAEVLAASKLGELIVVLGHEAQSSRALLTGLPLAIVINEHYRDGQMTSVHAGLNALKSASLGVMIALADQPLITIADINLLIDAFVHHQPESILVPTHKGQRGNPIIIADQYRESILQGKHNLGCKQLIKKNPHLVCTYEMENPHPIVDLDTLADYQKLELES